MLNAKQIVSSVFSIAAVLLTFFAVGKFIIFTSNPTQNSRPNVSIKNELQLLFKNKINLTISCRNLMLNCVWMILFILQHSLQKTETVKRFWARFQLEIIERTAYNLLSAYFLLNMLQNWRTVDAISLWNISAPVYSTVWWVFVLFHVLAWTIIVGGSLLMDLPEILGIKQIYYDVKKLNEPSLYKTRDLNRLLGHIRHPSYIGFTTVLWVTNFMSLDRFILSTFLTIYMYVAWNPDKKDYRYQKQQLQLKKLELSYDLK